ncbi:MAG: FAD:protein FMN transferase [Bacteroidota bacterium]|nr:FAD:protein FMN transferase [Bacteroidota bacterium]
MSRILSLFLFSYVFSANASEAMPEPLVVEGRTMGTTYRIQYFDEPLRRNFKESIDSLLVRLNASINNYDPKSDISRFNRSRKGTRPRLGYLCDILSKARDIYEASGGAFDPTVGPLINTWGFGPENSSPPSASRIDSMKQLVGLEKVSSSKHRISKSIAGVQLDMGGIGQGYGADVIVAFLRQKGVSDMLVELGGEGMALGRNLKKDQYWTIAILDPNSSRDNQYYKAYVVLRNQAFTTSGNYFNYRVIEGRKYGHTIDPFSGYPVQHSLLSASVFADNATLADGWATAFMVMGLEKAMAKIRILKNVEAIFFYSDATGKIATYVTPGIVDQVTLE